MKTRRLFSSLALALAVSFGAAGCGMVTPMATTDAYAPSDGIDVTVDTVAVRNAMLVADQTGENFNVVFTAVNNSDAPAVIRTSFAADNAEGAAEFLLAPGVNAIGLPSASIAPQLVSLPNVIAGSTVTGYFEVAGGASAEAEVPVLDGTLAEYKQYVLAPQPLVLEGEAEPASAG